MKYNPLLPISKIEAEEILKNTDDNKSLCELIFRIVYYIDDIKWLENKILKISELQSIDIKKTIITSISDIVRIHWFLPNKLEKLLNTYHKDSSISDYLDEYLEDIKYIINWK